MCIRDRGWGCYWLYLQWQPSVAVASLLASLMLALLSRVFSVVRRCPATVFLILSLIHISLAESIGFGLERPYALVTYHPETAGGASPAAQFDALCAALERCV